MEMRSLMLAIWGPFCQLRNEELKSYSPYIFMTDFWCFALPSEPKEKSVTLAR